MILLIDGCTGSSLMCGLCCCIVVSGGHSSCGVKASHCSDFCCGAQALGHMGSVVMAPGLQSSIIVVHGRSCPEACGILLDQRSNLCLLLWQVDSLPLSQQRNPQLYLRMRKAQFREFVTFSSCGSPKQQLARAQEIGLLQKLGCFGVRCSFPW